MSTKRCPAGSACSGAAFPGHPAHPPVTVGRSAADIRVKLAEINAEITTPRTSQSRLVALYSMETALRWVLGEEAGNSDLDAPIPMRWRKEDDDGVYVSTAGYRVRRIYQGSGRAAVWVAERPDNEPMPGWNTSSTAATAKTMCENDWRDRLRATPDL